MSFLSHTAHTIRASLLATEAEVACEAAGVLEAAHVADEGDQSRRGEQTDAGDREQLSDDGQILREALELGLGVPNARLEIARVPERTWRLNIHSVGGILPTSIIIPSVEPDEAPHGKPERRFAG